MPSEPQRDLAGRRIGPHLPLADGLLKAAQRAIEIGATAVQIFTDNPTAWRRRRDYPPKLAEFRALLASNDIMPLAVHAPYLVNLAGGDDRFWQQSVETLEHDLCFGAGFGARFLNLHAGSHRGLTRAEGIARLARGVARVLERVPAVTDDGAATPMLVLENSAGAGDAVGSTLDELAAIVEASVAAGAPAERIGICLDTAHLWAAGHQIDTAETIDRLVERSLALLGERLAMIHLNDARAGCGSRIDRHEHIGAGRIGSIALAQLLSDPRLRALPMYLETPGMDEGYDALNLDRVRQLIRGEPLAELPAAAFQLRGSRSRSAPPSGSPD